MTFIGASYYIMSQSVMQKVLNLNAVFRDKVLMNNGSDSVFIHAVFSELLSFLLSSFI